MATYRSRERVAAILAHREADRVPFRNLSAPEVSALLQSMELSEEERECYSEGDFKSCTFGSHPRRDQLAPYLPDLPEEALLSDWGVGQVAVKSVEGYHAGHRTFHPLAHVDTVKELERFPFPDMTAPERHQHLEKEIRAAKTQEFTVVGQMSQTILETAYEMRGIDRLFMDFYDRPEYIEALFSRIAEQRRFQARRFAEAGADVLRIGDDIASQTGLLISPSMYREWIKPWHAQVIASARQVNPDIPILYHSDGKLTALLPDLIEVGVTAINPVQPECMDSADIKRRFGDRLTLWGCSAVQSVYAHGREEDVLADLRKLMRTVAPGGGFVFQFTNIILTARVLDNLRCFFRAFYDLARYPAGRHHVRAATGARLTGGTEKETKTRRRPRGRHT